MFDANPARVWRAGHVPGARNLDPAAYAPSELPADKTATLIFYCSGPLCGAAPHAARRAKKLGYDRVFVLFEGISGWRRRHKPTRTE